jgi:hypothetical protein
VGPGLAGSLLHEKLVGRLVMAWSALEATLHGLLWAFLNVSMTDGRVVTSKLDVSMILQMLRAFGVQNLVESRQQAFFDVMNEIEDCRESRNFVVHGVWTTIEPQGTPSAMSLKPKTDVGEIVGETFPARRMHDIIRSIRLNRDHVLQLQVELQTSRDKLLIQRPRD